MTTVNVSSGCGCFSCSEKLVVVGMIVHFVTHEDGNTSMNTPETELKIMANFSTNHSQPNLILKRGLIVLL